MRLVGRERVGRDARHPRMRRHGRGMRSRLRHVYAGRSVFRAYRTDGHRSGDAQTGQHHRRKTACKGTGIVKTTVAFGILPAILAFGQEIEMTPTQARPEGRWPRADAFSCLDFRSRSPPDARSRTSVAKRSRSGDPVRCLFGALPSTSRFVAVFPVFRSILFFPTEPVFRPRRSGGRTLPGRCASASTPKRPSPENSWMNRNGLRGIVPPHDEGGHRLSPQR